MVGAVYDRGYRGYEGARGGRSAARLALLRASIRRALGFRRSWRQKFFPMTLLAIAIVPAIVFVGVGYVTRNTPASDFEFITYREYLNVSNALLVFVALTAPDIICPDRRHRVLPLVFARPLRGVDYVLAKVGSMWSILFAFMVVPQVVLFVGQMLVSDDGTLRYARENAEVIWQVPVAAAIFALYYSAIGVAVASLTTRRIIAGATIIGLFLASAIVSDALTGQWEQESQPTQVEGPPSTVITEDGQVIVVPSEGSDPFGDTVTDQYIERDPSAAGFLNLLTLPRVARDVVFLGHVERASPLSGLSGAGPLALLELAALIVVALGLLLVRYREVER